MPHNSTSPFRLSLINQTILAALFALPATAMADSCPGASTSISAATTDQCALEGSNSVTITGAGSIAYSNAFAYAITVSGNDNAIDNSGSVSGSGDFGWGIAIGDGMGAATITTLTNNGTISGSGGANGYGWGIDLRSGTIDTLTNSDTISGNGGTYGWGISVGDGMGSATITALTNNGTISGSGGTYGWGISIDDGLIGTLTNSGTISGSSGTFGWGISLGGMGASTITTLNNSGTISGSTNSVDVGMSGSIGTLNNSGTLDGAVNLESSATALNINGNSSRIIGAVTGSNTTVTVNGSFASEGAFNVSAFNVANGGTLNMAHGITTSAGASNDGVLAVAAGTTATLTGDYTQTANGIFRTAVTDDTTYGKLVVTGTATLPSSAQIDVDVAAPNFSFTTSSLAEVISAGTLTSDGTFSVTDNSALFDFDAALNGNAVDLTLTAASTGGGGGGGGGGGDSIGVEDAVTSTGNTPGLGAAKVFDDLIDTLLADSTTGDTGMDEVINALGQLATEQEVSDAISQTLPLMTASMNAVLTGTLQGTQRILHARQDANRGLSSGDGFFGDKQVWAKPFGNWADQDDNGGVSGFDADAWGVIFGADGVLNDRDRVGVAFAYASSDVDSNSSVAPNAAEVDSYQLAVYGSHSLDARTELSYQVDVGQHTTAGTRGIGLMGSVAKSDYDSDSAHVGAGMGHVYPLNDRDTVAAAIRADYTWLQDDAYTETGSGALNLDVAGNTTEALVLGVDGKYDHAVSDSVNVSANLGVGFDTINDASSITSAFAGAPTAAFVTKGLNLSPWIGTAGLGVSKQTANGVEISARYDVQVREDFDSQAVSVKLRMPF